VTKPAATEAPASFFMGSWAELCLGRRKKGATGQACLLWIGLRHQEEERQLSNVILSYIERKLTFSFE